MPCGTDSSEYNLLVMSMLALMNICHCSDITNVRCIGVTCVPSPREIKVNMMVFGLGSCSVVPSTAQLLHTQSSYLELDFSSSVVSLSAPLIEQLSVGL